MKKQILIVLISMLVSIISSQTPTWNQYTFCESISDQDLDSNFNWICTKAGLVKVDLLSNETEYFNSSNSQLPATFNNNFKLVIDNNGAKWMSIRNKLVYINDSELIIYDFTNSALLSEDIVSIAVDIDNSIWITYYDTLIRFYGEIWEVFDHGDFGYSNYIICNFKIDNEGNKWFTLYNQNFNAHLIRYDNFDWLGIGFSINNSLIGYIATDSDGLKWFSISHLIGFDWYGNPIFEYMVATYNGNNWQIFNESNSGYPADAGFYCIVFDENNIMWIGSESGLLKFENSLFTIFNSDNSGLPGNDIMGLVVDNSGLLWIGTRTSGMASFDGVQWEVYNNENSDYPSGWLRNLQIDCNGNIWIATSSRVSKFDGENFASIAVSNSILTTNNLTCIALGLDGTKWIGTWFHSLYSVGSDGWNCYDTENSGLPYSNINCVEIDSYGDKWIGTDLGVAIYDDYNWCVFNTENSELPSNEIEAIAFGPDGVVWIGTDDGLARFNLISWNVYNTTNSQLPHNHIQSLVVDDDDVLWVGTNDNFASFDGENWSVYDLMALGFEFNSVVDIAIDEFGSKWIAVPAEGLIHFNGINWQLFDSVNSDLPSNWVKDITIDEYGAKWIATTNGIAKLNDNLWTVYDFSNSGLPHNRVKAICIDENNTKWIATEGGLGVYNENGIPVSTFEFELPVNINNSVLSNYPNPFNPSTTISFELTAKDAQGAKLEIYNLKGQKVKSFSNLQITQSINHQIIWDGTDQTGKSVSSGIYFCNLIVDGKMLKSKKMMLVK
ncbi:MAG: two-component regulator propeller domain-containing protein [Candidatus Cloacimonadales bacterium]|nr:two-component regulator propeller domain-containing protein [Candidatus Cloacimonadales bacterium]